MQEVIEKAIYYDNSEERYIETLILLSDNIDELYAFLKDIINDTKFEKCIKHIYKTLLKDNREDLVSLISGLALKLDDIQLNKKIKELINKCRKLQEY